MSERLSAAIVIPCLNEEEAIGPCVANIVSFINQQTLTIDIQSILVVDNGSTDDTAQVATDAGATVIMESRRGYGRACLTGVEAANGTDLIILMDGDGSDRFEDIVSLVEPLLRDEADLVIGSRIRGSHDPGSLSPQQILGNRIATTLFGLLYRVRLTDIGPFRVIRREHLLALGMSEMTYGWSIEMIAKSVRSGLRVLEVPVSYRNRSGGVSKVSGNFKASIRAGVRIIGAILRTRRAPVTELR
ncbi:MAG: glycosyltransferase family 2 protein [Thermomicrobiales bacterium]